MRPLPTLAQIKAANPDFFLFGVDRGESYIIGYDSDGEPIMQVTTSCTKPVYHIHSNNTLEFKRH